MGAAVVPEGRLAYLITHVDESLRPGADGLYVVASVTTISAEVARSCALGIDPRGRRFHWRNEADAERLKMLDALLDLGCELAVYVAHPCPTARHERARAKCLEALLWDLRTNGVKRLIIESRGPSGDRRDRRTVSNAIRAKMASPNVVYHHDRPSAEPGLWLPDAVAGAHAAHVSGRTSRYRQILGPRLRECQIRV